MASPVGRSFGPYLVLSPLGRGGMGETFLAERRGQAGVTQRVCLKRLRVDAEDPSWVSMFQTEARLVASLKHPNVISLVDFGHQGDEWWMALELSDGIDLRAILNALAQTETPFPIDAALFVVTELAKALAHAHERRLDDGSPAGIVHRDVAPGNVLVSRDGAVQLTDFGIAKVAQGDKTRTGVQKGKAEYMSPEHAMGQVPLDGRSDLFALGVVLFELLAGERPFDGPTPYATQFRAYNGERPRLEALAPHVPRGVVAIADRLLEPARDARYASARALVDALSEMPVPANVAFRLGALVEGTLRMRAEAGIGGPAEAPTRVDR